MINFTKKYTQTICLLVVILLAPFVAIFGFVKDSSAPDTDTQELSQSPVDQPDESRENAINYTWAGTAEEPKEIRIPALNVKSYIQKMGTDKNNKIAAPSNIHLAGWYNGSVVPGQDGISIIAGHVTGVSEDGIFVNLKNIKIGEEFEIETGGGVVYRYRVLNVIKVAEKDAMNFLFSAEPGINKQLNLITCGGEFDTDSNQYEDRVIVSSKVI